MTKRSLVMHSAVGHGHVMPDEYTRRIPKPDAEILNFFLRFLADQGLPQVAVYVNGGYVRDMLLGKEPDDLDISLCLRDCQEEVTVAGLLQLIGSYVEKRPEFGIMEFKNATILSNESKDKQLDTFKAHFTNKDGVKTEVDVMPTIGEEKYSEDTRIPIRDQRGKPEEDALRRDLTIGALLLRVSHREGEQGSAETLQYELLDFYGGVDDIRNGILRSPCPSGRNPSDVRAVVLRTPEEKELASLLGIDEMPPSEAVQVLWWVKVLMDDPVRICRAFRFAAKFRFTLHPSFWKAVPFALESLRAKVAGSRKNTEYQKIGGYGFKASSDFYELAFSYTFGPGEGTLRLASALLGGQDEKGKPKLLSKVCSFDLELYRKFVEEYQKPGLGAEELIGGLMAAAIAAAEFEEGGSGAEAEFTQACDGMCVSNAMREAGRAPLHASKVMAADPAPANSLDCLAAEACGISAEELGRHVQVWEAMQSCTPRSSSGTGTLETAAARLRFALELLRRAKPELAGQVEQSIKVLSFSRPAVRGAVLQAKGVLEVPPPLRRQVMVLFEVCLRLLRYEAPVEDVSSLEVLFEAHPKLRLAFSNSVWMDADGKTVKSEFQPPKRSGGEKKRGR